MMWGACRLVYCAAISFLLYCWLSARSNEEQMRELRFKEKEKEKVNDRGGTVEVTDVDLEGAASCNAAVELALAQSSTVTAAEGGPMTWAMWPCFCFYSEFFERAMLLTALTTSLFASASEQTAVAGLYGLSLVHNSPSQPGLVRFDAKTGAATLISPPPVGMSLPLAATGDLNELDASSGVMYYLGDTGSGTTLAALNVTDGTLLCTRHIAVQELGYVGIGQSLSMDGKRSRLVISGLLQNKAKTNCTHSVWSLDVATAVCGGKLVQLGSFGDAIFSPMVHSSAYDAKSGRLFTLLATGKSGPDAVGIIDLSGPPGTAALAMKVIDEQPSGASALFALRWDQQTSTVVGLWPIAGGLELHALNPLSGKWSAAQVTSEFGALLGNDGTVNAFDPTTGTLYVLVGKVPTSGGDPVMRIASVNMKANTLKASPPIQTVGLCQGCVLSLAWAHSG